MRKFQGNFFDANLKFYDEISFLVEEINQMDFLPFPWILNELQFLTSVHFSPHFIERLCQMSSQKIIL